MAKRISTLSGPNLNLLGEREPEIFSFMTLEAIEKSCRTFACDLEVELDFRQTNREDALMDAIQEACAKKVMR